MAFQPDYDFLMAKLHSLANRRTTQADLQREEIATILVTTFPFEWGIPDVEKLRAARRAIGALALKPSATGLDLTRAIRREIQGFVSAPPRRLVLTSLISATLPSETESKTFFNDSISIRRSFLKRFADARDQILGNVPEYRDEPLRYNCVLVEAEGRSAYEAFDRALWRLDVLRSAWNLVLDERYSMRSSARPQPVNRVRLGQLYTLHSIDGKTAFDSYWYDADYTRETHPVQAPADWQRLTVAIRSRLRRLSRLRYRADAEKALVMYGRALDTKDMTGCFYKLWSTLEFAMHSGSKYEQLVKRGQFLFSDSPLARHALDHLRKRRNQIVHSGDPASQMEPLVYQLKHYVEAALRYHLGMGRHFSTLAEAGAFLDLPPNIADLGRRIALARLAMRFRR